MAKANQIKTVDFLRLLFGKVALMTNIGKPMNSTQMDLTADLIINDSQLSQLTFSDINLCINKGLSGYFGKLYDNIDTTILCTWLRKYRDEKSKIKNENNVLQLQQNVVPMPNYIKENIKQLTKNKTDLDLKEVIKQVYEPTETEKKSHQLMKEFDELHKKNPGEKGVFRAIECDGRLMTCSEYIEFKINQ